MIKFTFAGISNEIDSSTRNSIRSQIAKCSSSKLQYGSTPETTGIFWFRATRQAAVDKYNTEAAKHR